MFCPSLQGTTPVPTPHAPASRGFIVPPRLLPRTDTRVLREPTPQMPILVALISALSALSLSTVWVSHSVTVSVWWHASLCLSD